MACQLHNNDFHMNRLKKNQIYEVGKTFRKFTKLTALGCSDIEDASSLVRLVGRSVPGGPEVKPGQVVFLFERIARTYPDDVPKPFPSGFQPAGFPNI
jgi:hypothetical protein